MWGRLQALHPFRAQSSNPDNIINSSIFEAMPKYNPNSSFSDCWASVGNITFYHRNRQCYFRKKSVCKFPRTKEQIAVSEIHSRALVAWRTLGHSVQLRWNECAKAVPPHRPPVDKTTHTPNTIFSCRHTTDSFNSGTSIFRSRENGCRFRLSISSSCLPLR